MPVRPPDFKSSGVRVERIIASGSTKNPRLLIIGSGSTQSDGVTVNTDTLRLSGTGSDTWLFISGSTGTTDRITLGGNTFLSGVLFGGNLAITGTQVSVQSQVPHGGQDVNFFVEGIAGSKDTSTRGTSVFVGDMVVSGVIRDGTGLAYYAGASTGPDGVSGDLQFNDGSGGFGASSTLNFDIGTDTLSLTTLVANAGISGSLTTLADGSSYLIEGSNITILSSSNGSITISSTGGGSTSNWNELSPSPRLNTTASVAIAGGLGSSYAAANVGSDVFFFVSGSRGSIGTAIRGTSAFSGDVFVSGSTTFGASTGDRLVVGSLLASDIVPDSDRTRNLGSASSRFANIYTGDLHLRNDRGDWTVIEEPEFLTVTNNKTGKRFKILMEPID